MDQDAQNDRLREEYRGAFNDWALEVSRLQQIAETSQDDKTNPSAENPKSVVEAEGRVLEAERLYRTTRDRLADEMKVASATSGGE